MSKRAVSKTRIMFFFVLGLLACLAFAPAAPAADAPADGATASAPAADVTAPAAEATAAAPAEPAAGDKTPGTIASDGSNMSQYVQDSWVVSGGCGM